MCINMVVKKRNKRQLFNNSNLIIHANSIIPIHKKDSYTNIYFSVLYKMAICLFTCM